MKQIFILFIITAIALLSSCQTTGTKSPKANSVKNDSIKILTKNFNDNPGSPIEYKVPMKLDADGKFVRHGTTVRYLKSGKVAGKTTYVMDKKEGVRYTYHSTGKIYKEQPYENNKLSGICKRYDRQGKVTAEYPYKSGMPGIGLVEYTNLGKKRPVPVISIIKKDEIASNGRYKLILSISGKGKERVKSVQFYHGKLIEGKYFHQNLTPARNLSSKKGEIVIELRKGTVFNKTINVVAVVTTTSKLKLILQKPVKISVRGL